MLLIAELILNSEYSFRPANWIDFPFWGFFPQGISIAVIDENWCTFLLTVVLLNAEELTMKWHPTKAGSLLFDSPMWIGKCAIHILHSTWGMTRKKSLSGTQQSVQKWVCSLQNLRMLQPGNIFSHSISRSVLFLRSQMFNQGKKKCIHLFSDEHFGISINFYICIAMFFFFFKYLVGFDILQSKNKKSG